MRVTMLKTMFRTFLFQCMGINSLTAALTQSSWGGWSECSKSCFGIQERTRACPVGTPCTADQLREKRECNTQGCRPSFEVIAASAILGGLLLLAIIIMIVLIIKRKNAQRRLMRMPVQSQTLHIEDALVESYYDASMRRTFPAKRSFYTFPQTSASDLSTTDVTLTSDVVNNNDSVENQGRSQAQNNLPGSSDDEPRRGKLPGNNFYHSPTSEGLSVPDVVESSESQEKECAHAPDIKPQKTDTVSSEIPSDQNQEHNSLGIQNGGPENKVPVDVGNSSEKQKRKGKDNGSSQTSAKRTPSLQSIKEEANERKTGVEMLKKDSERKTTSDNETLYHDNDPISEQFVKCAALVW